MSKSVFKYTLPLPSVECEFTEMLLPTGTQILRVAEQRGDGHMWALVDQQHKGFETREFMVVGTGWAFDHPDAKYVGTFMTAGGAFVWHVFERVGL